MHPELRPARWRTKPPPGVMVDALHPLAPWTAWLFNEGAGAQLFDATLGITSSAFVGSPTRTATTDGGYGSALRFVAASSQSVTAVTRRPGVASNNQPFTMAILFRTTSVATTGLDPFGEGDGTLTNPAAFFRIGNIVAGRLEFLLRNDAGTQVSPHADSGVHDGLWHWSHAVSEGPSGLLRIYLDGSEVANGANTLGSGALTDTLTRFGARSTSSTPAAFFDGDLSCVLTWNRALGAAEVENHVAQPFQMFLALRPTLSFATSVARSRRTLDPRAGARGVPWI